MTTKSKFFRVALEGGTTDGRQIERNWITQMAKNFNREKYGARVWLEHYRGVLPDSPFKAYGDVLAVKAEEVTIDGKKRMALFAQIEPLPALVQMNKAKQKIYTSIEVTPKFSDTGEAYLTGLAVTDTPASLGTEALAFVQNASPAANPFNARKSDPTALFSEAIEVELEFEDDDADDSGKQAAKFSDTLKNLMGRFTGKTKTDDARFNEVLSAFEDLGEVLEEQGKQYSALKKENTALRTQLDGLDTRFKELTSKLEKTPSAQHTQRPPATGGTGVEQTDC